VDRKKVAESETWRVEEAYWAHNLTASGLDLEPETEVTKLRMAHGAPYMSRLHEVIRWLAEQAPTKPVPRACR
jgi:hypothetical protein